MNNLIINPVGVTTKKKTKAIITGETNLPSNIPNLNHSKFNGVRIDELNSPKIKKANEVIRAHSLYSWLLIRGYKEIAKKNIKKTIPKLLLEEILIFLLIIKMFIFYIFKYSI